MKPKITTLFSQYIQYCRSFKDLRPKTIEGYEDIFKTFCVVMPEVQFAGDVTPARLDEFFHRLQTRTRTLSNGKQLRGVKASTIRTYGSKLHTFFDWLCTRGHLQENPVDRKTLARPEYVDNRALKRKEVEKLLSAIAQHSHNRFLLKRDLAIIHVFLFAGLRRTELLSLRVPDVDLDRRILTVRGKTSKSKYTRHVPISGKTIWCLQDYLEERRKTGDPSEWLWLSYGGKGRFTEYGLRHWVRSLIGRSGVKFHVHRFRHTFACMLGRNDVSAIKIQKLLGHTDLRMTQVYLRSLGVEDVRDSVSSLSIESLSAN